MDTVAPVVVVHVPSTMYWGVAAEAGAATAPTSPAATISVAAPTRILRFMGISPRLFALQAWGTNLSSEAFLCGAGYPATTSGRPHLEAGRRLPDPRVDERPSRCRPP